MHYEALLTFKTLLKTIKGPRIEFTYKLFNENNELINEVGTELAYVFRDTWKPCGIPDFVLKPIAKNSKAKPINI